MKSGEVFGGVGTRKELRRVDTALDRRVIISCWKAIVETIKGM